MNFIGVDLHKKIITVCVMNEKLVVVGRKTLYASQPGEIVAFLQRFRRTAGRNTASRSG
jgi:hypothetical protein